MEQTGELIIAVWQGVAWPLARLIFFVSLGVMVGNFIEALNWTHHVARLARPLIRMGRLSDVVGASFSMAFFSGVASNTMLAEAYDQGRLGKQELVLANLFNSLPRFFLHLPTVFFLTVPLIKAAAFIYVGLTLCAAALQTGLICCAGRFLRVSTGDLEAGAEIQEKEPLSFKEAAVLAWTRFKKRIGRLARFTVPVYILFFLLHRYGIFDQVEHFIANRVPFLSWLAPESLGIVVLHVTAEFTAGLAAAGALLDGNSLGYRDIVLALMVGNVLAAPVRAVRHQFPYYAGIFSPRLALELIFYSQSFRVVTILTVTFVFYVVTA